MLISFRRNENKMLQVKTKLFNGAKILINTLQNSGVDTIFGYPGSVVLNVYEELSKQNTIKHFLVRHEQAAVHAAEGYAKVSGKTGVVLVTSGPGATNIVTGCADAYFDGIPLVIITGQVDKNLSGKNAFQEINIIDMTKSCSKAGFQISDVKELEQTLVKAFEISQSGKKGPVIVDITQNVFSDSADYKAAISHQTLTATTNTYDFSSAERLINQSKRPVVIAGAGVLNSDAQKELFDFVKKLNAPVVSTMMGLGAYPQDVANYLGMLGIYGHNSANEVLKLADLIIVLGARLNDRITMVFKPEDFDKNIIQVDINPEELGRNFKATEKICTDIKNFLQDIDVMSKSDGWLNTARALKTLNKSATRKSNLLHSDDVIKEIYKYTDTVTTEVGQHQIFAVQNLPYGVKLLTSGGFGTMGFGFPAAIGAAAANPKKTVTCIAGDGSFQMNIQELATLKEYNLPVKIMVLNNGYLGMVRQLQESRFNGNYYETKISNPDFVKLAESYGIQALRVSCLSDLKPALESAFADNTPFLIDFIVEQMEEV